MKDITQEKKDSAEFLHVSIIVPVYNGEKTIGACLSSIFDSKINVPYEVIVVDDASTDRTPEVVKGFNCAYLRRLKRQGVAAARNEGIRAAKGEIIFFFDADVRLKPDMIPNALKHLQEDADTKIVQARWDEVSPLPTFSSRFFLLKDRYNIDKMFEGKKRLEVANLATGCQAVRREVFDNVGLFNESYRISGGEEHELGMRVMQKYKIYFYNDLFVRHGFSSLWRTSGKIYWRTINFAMLRFKCADKDFMKLHKHSVPLQDKISVVVIFCFLGALLGSFIYPGFFLPFAWLLGAAYLLNISGFFIYMVRKENMLFALRGISADFLIMVPRLLGILTAGWIFYILKQKEFKI